MRKRQNRRRLSMTSLIDVIFLLLLFFMLTSTFTRFSEVELTAAGAGRAALSGKPPLFLKLGETDMTLNLQKLDLDQLETALITHRGDATDLSLLVAMDDHVSAQRLTDVLVVLRAIPGLKPTVLGAT
ncbi:MAG: biopolymer transporter ExbD [Pelagimonas sp.]|jgi:biopolymer transport protein ExbD|nr:biopolymer transporter ExbD [Pelagimonas sp.]